MKTVWVHVHNIGQALEQILLLGLHLAPLTVGMAPIKLLHSKVLHPLALEPMG